MRRSNQLSYAATEAGESTDAGAGRHLSRGGRSDATPPDAASFLSRAAPRRDGMGPMAKGKSVVVTFRVDAHLAEALEHLPDKSAFIRKALAMTFHETCPACAGEGRLDC